MTLNFNFFFVLFLNFKIKYAIVFESVVVIVFQSVFNSEKYINNIFLFFKNYFWDQHIKMIWKYQKHINLKQKKIKYF
jgi:hypothetical protein